MLDRWMRRANEIQPIGAAVLLVFTGEMRFQMRINLFLWSVGE
jgi:hypothetical protein